MAATKTPIARGRQQVVPRRNTIDWKTDDPKELKRQLLYFEQNLLGSLQSVQSLLRVVDGNQTPPLILPERKELEFAGDGVVLTVNERRIKATIAGFEETWTEFDVGALTGSQNNFNGGDSAQWQACDFFRITSWSSTRAFTGFEAPTTGSTKRIKWGCNATGSDVTVTNASGSSSAANRVLCSQGLSATIKTGEVFPILHDETTNSWRLLHRRTVERSGDTMDSGANLVFQAGDITGLDDLTFNGSGSILDMASGAIVNVVDLVLQGTASELDANGGSIINLDDLTFEGAGSVLSMTGGDITGVDDITMNGSGSVIDGAGSTIQNFGTLTMDGPGSVISDVDEFYLEDSGSVFDAADGTISDVGILEINDGVARGLPSGEPARIVGFNGDETACIGELAVLSNEFNVNLPIYYSRVDNATSSTTFTPTIDFSDIHGLDFSGGVVRVKVTVQSFRNDATEVAYGPQDVSQSFTIMLNTGSNAKCYPRYIDNGATIYREYTNYFDDSYTITFTEVSSTEILFTGSLTGTGTRTAAMLIELEYGIVP